MKRDPAPASLSRDHHHAHQSHLRACPSCAVIVGRVERRATDPERLRAIAPRFG